MGCKARSTSSQEFYSQMNKKLILSGVTALIMELELVVCCFYIGDSAAAYAMNFAILILGTSVGWLIGTVISPYDTKEQGDFSAYAKAVSAFVTGYLVAKVDKIIEHLFSPTFLSAPEAAFRMVLFLSAVLIAMLVTFINRRYA